MLCTQCAAVSYSAAAKILVERGERCPKCGAPLSLAPEESAVGAGAKDAGRRGERDS
jgi:hypothetical protein